MSVTPTGGYDWTFDPDRSDGGIQVDSVDNDMPEYRPGKSYSLDFVFWTNPSDPATVTADTGGTLGGTTGFTLGGATGASVGQTADPGTHIDRYKAVREYSRWAGRYALEEAIDGTPIVSEYTPADATVDSIVVKLEPGPSLPDTPGLWVVLDDVTDETRFIEDLARISLDFVVLARGDQYDTRSALLDDIGSTI